MASRHHNPDDLTCRPTAFRRYDPDGSIEKTFWVHGDWHLVSTKKLGELVVRETTNGPLLRIAMDLEL